MRYCDYMLDEITDNRCLRCERATEVLIDEGWRWWVLIEVVKTHIKLVRFWTRTISAMVWWWSCLKGWPLYQNPTLLLFVVTAKFIEILDFPLTFVFTSWRYTKYLISLSHQEAWLPRLFEIRACGLTTRNKEICICSHHAVQLLVSSRTAPVLTNGIIRPLVFEVSNLPGVRWQSSVPLKTMVAWTGPCATERRQTSTNDFFLFLVGRCYWPSRRSTRESRRQDKNEWGG